MIDLMRLRDVPGVAGAVHVAQDGRLVSHAVNGPYEHMAVVTTRLGETVRKVGEVMGYEKFDYALLHYEGGDNPILIFPQNTALIGLSLYVPQALVGFSQKTQTFFRKELIAASHILTRIRAIMMEG